jgi:hypothetical protein
MVMPAMKTCRVSLSAKVLIIDRIVTRHVTHGKKQDGWLPIISRLGNVCQDPLTSHRAFRRLLVAARPRAQGHGRKYDYPPDKQEKATATVLEPAALLSAQWATA